MTHGQVWKLRTSLPDLNLYYRVTGRITADETDKNIFRKGKIVIANASSHYYSNKFDVLLGPYSDLSNINDNNSLLR